MRKYNENKFYFKNFLQPIAYLPISLTSSCPETVVLLHNIKKFS